VAQIARCAFLMALSLADQEERLAFNPEFRSSGMLPQDPDALSGEEETAEEDAE